MTPFVDAYIRTYATPPKHNDWNNELFQNGRFICPIPPSPYSLLHNGQFYMLSKRAGLPVQMILKLLAKLLHKTQRRHGRRVA